LLTFSHHLVLVLQANPDKAFDEWAAKHGKAYSDAERDSRLAVWLENLAYIESHNDNTKSYWVRSNHGFWLPSNTAVTVCTVCNLWL